VVSTFSLLHRVMLLPCCESLLGSGKRWDSFRLAGAYEGLRSDRLNEAVVTKTANFSVFGSSSIPK
jgi:hypothetical protein